MSVWTNVESITIKNNTLTEVLTGEQYIVWSIYAFWMCKLQDVDVRHRKHKKRDSQLSLSFAARTGIEPMILPWEGSVLTPWPTSHLYDLLDARHILTDHTSKRKCFFDFFQKIFICRFQFRTAWFLGAFLCVAVEVGLEKRRYLLFCKRQRCKKA